MKVKNCLEHYVNLYPVLLCSYVARLSFIELLQEPVFYVQWEAKIRLKITSSKTSSVNMINHDLLSFDLYAMAAYI